jgi:hypothetical protein
MFPNVPVLVIEFLPRLAVTCAACKKVATGNTKFRLASLCIYLTTIL